jgi:very-short-patch-repair endonuclease
MPRVIRGQPDYLDIKRRLRSNMTGPEARLWSRLRARQLQGLKFRRQHGIGPYIVDFYCPEQSLVIEVDGDSHADADQVVKDKQREQYLQSLGLRVIRYINDDIVKNLGGILEDLAERISSRSTSPRPSLPRRGKEAES